MMKNAFYIIFKKLFLFLGYLNFCPDSFVHVGKRFDNKASVSFKIYNFTYWDGSVIQAVITCKKILS